MVYRRTEKVTRRLAQRRAAILLAARDVAAEHGLPAVQIAPVAARAGIAAGTMYRYFPAKSDLVAGLLADVSGDVVEVMRAAAAAAPGPLSALAAALTALAARVAARPRLIWAIMAESVDASVDERRRDFRAALANEIAARIAAASVAGHLPEQNAATSALALLGALVEGLAGPLAPAITADHEANRDRVRALTLIALRAVGVLDARARGLVVQTVLPAA